MDTISPITSAADPVAQSPYNPDTQPFALTPTPTTIDPNLGAYQDPGFAGRHVMDLPDHHFDLIDNAATPTPAV